MTRSGRPRGFTLLEMMTVVAIIGVLSALAGTAFLNISKVARVNGGTATLSRLLTSTRMRAIVERCPYFVQINGPTYDPSSAPADILRAPGQVLIYRKGDCNSATAWYDSGTSLANRDKLVEQISLSEFTTIINVAPTGVVTSNQLGGGSLTVYYSPIGLRLVAADNDADGVSTASVVSGDLTLELVAPPATASEPRRSVVIPTAGTARAP